MEKASSEPVVELHELEEQAPRSEVENQGNVTNEDMKRFFTQYLTIDEEAILILNQKPQVVDSGYWEAYNAYKIKTNQILGEYLSDSAKKELEKPYIHDDFHYPRFLEINDYMVTAISNVEDAVITSRYVQNSNNVYEVMVTAIANVINVEWANKQYKWNESKGYYVENINSDLQIKQETELKTDRIKVTLNYWLVAPPKGRFEIHSVKEKSGISLGIDEQTNAKNNFFMTRVPYKDEVRDKDRQKIHQFLDSFMKQEYNFYNFYRKAHNTNYETLKTVLESDLGLMNIVKLKQEDYQSQFSPLMIPIKDDMDFLSFNAEEDIIITPHISSSEKHPVYQVEVQADVTLLKGESIPCEYSYLFIFEDDMISTVRFIALNKDNKDKT